MLLGNTPKHDELIVELIQERARIKVVRDHVALTFHRKFGLWLPTTKIFVFNEQQGRYRLARLQPDPSGYPRMRITVKVLSKPHEYWLSAHRISFVDLHGPTPLEINHIDNVRTNFNDWNLEDTTHTENMLMRNPGPEYFHHIAELLHEAYAHLQPEDGPPQEELPF